MRVLWIVNTIFPELAHQLNLEKTVYGGWMYKMADVLVERYNIKLSIATIYNGDFLEKSVNNKNYILIPKANKSLIKEYWHNVKQKYQPDIVHIHGTEYDYGLLYIQQNGPQKVVFSIQGLINVCAKYYLAGLSFGEIISNLTFRDLVKFDSIYQQKNKFKKRGEQELEYFKNCSHVIGRTEWDKAHSFFYNKNIKYHFCNEMLRDGFYNSPKWCFNNCHPRTIFLSQASYPLKGLHKVLDAVSILKNEFPDIRIKVAGHNIVKNDTYIDRLKLSGYGSIIKNKIKKLKLTNHIEFLGDLAENEIIDQYLKANLFICSSVIENSPNSLAEAQMLGVPVLSSYVGGVPNMVSDGVDGMIYRFEEIEMLVYKIRQIFLDNSLIKIISKNAIHSAELRNDSKLCDLISIYKEICYKDVLSNA